MGILITTPVNGAVQTNQSARLHMKCTVQRAPADVLHVHVTIYDDDAFTEPMVATNIWHRKTGPNWQVLDNEPCSENNQDAPDLEAAVGFRKFLTTRCVDARLREGKTCGASVNDKSRSNSTGTSCCVAATVDFRCHRCSGAVALSGTSELVR